MRINKKKFFDFIYLTTGSCILIIVSFVVIQNFIKDSGVFAQDTIIVFEDTNKETSKKQTDKNNDEYKTIKYKRTQEPTATPKKLISPDKLLVEIVNYSGVKESSEGIKAILESHKYKVSVYNTTSVEPVTSSIIERNDNGAGDAIRKIIKFNVTRVNSTNSKADITIVIGTDYKP